MLGVIVAHIERSQFIADLSTGYKADRIFPQRKIQVYIAFYIKLSDCFSSQSHFTDGMIMEYITFMFGQFSSYEYLILIVFVISYAFQVHQRIFADFIGGKCRQSGFGIFIEPFQQGNTYGVFDSYIGRTVFY